MIFIYIVDRIRLSTFPIFTWKFWYPKMAQFDDQIIEYREHEKSVPPIPSGHGIQPCQHNVWQIENYPNEKYLWHLVEILLTSNGQKSFCSASVWLEQLSDEQVQKMTPQQKKVTSARKKISTKKTSLWRTVAKEKRKKSVEEENYSRRKPVKKKTTEWDNCWRRKKTLPWRPPSGQCWGW